jgi:hypothetical protein
MLFSALAGILAGLALSVNAIPTLSIKGSKFFDSNGDQFFIKGMSMQMPFCDALFEGHETLGEPRPTQLTQSC